MFTTESKEQPEMSRSLTENTLRGEVNRVVFESCDEAYSVFKIVDLQGVEHTAAGPVTGVYAGQGIEVTGSWENHKEHGKQFKVREYKFTLPATEEGLKRYLASGIVPGIGPKTAEAIVGHFGLKALEILDKYSSRLKEIPGLGKKKIEAIKKAWQEHAEKKEIHIFLQGLGITPAYCARIIKTYGDNAADAVMGNPYALADDVNGIGFLMADRVADKLGIGHKDIRRLKAGILYALTRLSQSGHSCCPEENFINYSCDLLGVDESGTRAGLEEAVSLNKAVIDDGLIPGMRMIYDRAMFKAETELPLLLDRIASSRRHYGQRLAKIKVVQSGAHLSEKQMSAVEAVSNWPLTIITGGPGVGKTTVVGEIVKKAFAAKIKVFLCAPTGRAAKRLSESSGLSAMTIHRMLKWEPAEKKFMHGIDSPLRCGLLIVDEVSMLDLPLAVCLFRALRAGTSVVLVGDADQLPSVGPGRILNDLIDSGIFPVTKLTEIFRQGAGSRIIFNAHAVNHGRMPELPEISSKKELADFYWIEQEDPEKVLDIIRKMITERIPLRFGFDPLSEIQVLTPMNRGNCGTFAINKLLQESLNDGQKVVFKAGERLFKSGDRVMQIRNNYDKNVFNGDMGRIINIDHKALSFTVLYDSTRVLYEFGEAEEIVHAYAITVHKSQGSEFSAVIIPLLTQHYMMLRRKLLYTGMTRARKLLILIGSRKAIGMAVRNSAEEPRYSMLIERLKKLSGRDK